ncbi:helix-turn-helix transcriptional regulator [Streptomyces sp. UNOC14_S4]|uniref:helix-turn-helix transcriptional regulator n=1 Tax=Streptomyces sp. UNOC14_S4 TaxID=2872340 RepID=UPI001E55FADA|nr:helix-turn-helix transcriptional regulator [Streptomyces sp. UNOC14_S4]MCC3772812.1 helix-turn-helix transcriptional regulator [Streptomyces sp. UNOC14_S4]
MLSAMGPNAVRETVPCEPCELPTEQPAGNGAVELVTGSHAIAERLSRLRLAATREIRTLMAQGSWTTPGDAVNGAPERAVVAVAALARDLPPVLPRPGGRAVRLRVVGHVPAEFVLADRAAALLSLSPRAGGPGEPAALLVRQAGLLASLSELFESTWQEARPPHDRTAEDPAEDLVEGPDAVDLEVLSLLFVGLTDTSVARQLGLGLRTVQRRVKRLMELAGVTTRLQLGRHAAERGWTERR